MKYLSPKRLAVGTVSLATLVGGGLLTGAEPAMSDPAPDQIFTTQLTGQVSVIAVDPVTQAQAPANGGYQAEVRTPTGAGVLVPYAETVRQGITSGTKVKVAITLTPADLEAINPDQQANARKDFDALVAGIPNTLERDQALARVMTAVIEATPGTESAKLTSLAPKPRGGTRPAPTVDTTVREHTMDVVVVSRDGSDWYGPGRRNEVVEWANDYWARESRGIVSKVSLGKTAVTKRAADSANACAYGYQSDVLAALGYGPGNNPYQGESAKHLLAVLPPDCRLWWAGMGSVGQSLASGGSITVTTNTSALQTSPDTVNHELGHNFSIGHSNIYNCTPKTRTEGWVPEQCDRVEYGDGYDVMGGAKGGALNGNTKVSMGVIKEGTGMKTIETPGTTDVDLSPASTQDRAATQVIRVKDPYVKDKYYFLDFRQSTGIDTNQYWGGYGYLSKEDGSAMTATARGKWGIRILTSLADSYPEGITGHNDIYSMRTSMMAKDELKTNSSYEVASGGITIQVISADQTSPTAKVRVTVAGSLPSLTGGTASITGCLHQGCTLTAAAADFSPTPESVSYQWYADGQAITGGTGQTLVLGAQQAGKNITVKATASKAGYQDTTVESAAISVTAGSNVEIADPVLKQCMQKATGTQNLTVQNLAAISPKFSCDAQRGDNNAPVAYVRSLEGMQYMTGISFFQIYGSAPSFEPISGLDKLTGIWFHGRTIDGSRSPLKDLRPLSHLSKLNNLYVNGHSITSTEGISQTTQWDFLYLSDNQISDISSFNTMTGATNLGLSGNPGIRDYTPLASKPFGSVSLSGNKITDDMLPAIAKINTGQLALDRNELTSVSALGGRNYKISLNVSDNKITNICPLRASEASYGLIAENNEITDISCLTGTNFARVGNGIWLRGNRITDFRPLTPIRNRVYATGQRLNLAPTDLGKPTALVIYPLRGTALMLRKTDAPAGSVKVRDGSITYTSPASQGKTVTSEIREEGETGDWPRFSAIIKQRVQ